MNTDTTSIVCAACGRLNLPGGVRCIYCGTHCPPALDFDLGASAPPLSGTGTPAPAVGQAASNTKGQGKAAGAVSSLALLALKAKSLFALFKIGKIALTFGSMLISILAYAQLFKLPFAIGFVVCIFIHELGHVFVNWRKGLKQTAPMFIPFVGAVIFIKSFPDEPTVESESGAGGPAAGALAAFVCLLIGMATGNPFWYALASIGFLINLFNLAPFGQLDGAHIAAVFSPAIWNGVMLAILLVALKLPFYTLWAILGANLLARMTHSKTPTRYLLAAPVARIRMAAIYVLLCVGLSWGVQQTGAYIGTQRKQPRTYAQTARAPISGLPLASATNAANGADVTHAADAQAQTSVAPALRATRPPVSPALRSHAHVVFYILIGIIVAASGGLWLLITYLLAVAASKPMSVRSLVLPGLMFGLFLLITFVPLPFKNGLTEMIATGAFFAGAVFALGFAIQQAYKQGIKNGGRRVRPAPIALLARCLAWAAGGAMLVAYTANSAFVAGVVAIMALGFYVRHRWMPLCVAAAQAESLGDYPRALSLLARARELGPDRDSLTQIWTRILRLNLFNDRGAATLAALDARAALRTDQENAALSGAAMLGELESRSAALMLLDRYDEALTCCEQMLQSGPDDRLGPLRLLTVHSRLGRIALHRGWTDEAIAQAEWCMNAARKMPVTYQARLQTARSLALAAQGNAAEARTASEQAFKTLREPYTQAMSALVAAQLLLKENDASAAERESARALRLLPDSLPCRYWQARALSALDRPEGRELLRGLASEFPNEHWGRQAAISLAPAAS